MHNEKLYSSNLEVGFIECHHDSADLKQVWFALTALAILFFPFVPRKANRLPND